MSQQHPAFEPPVDLESPIWRYMNFPKFVSMLEHSGLFFVRADKLGDEFEGSVPALNAQLLRRAFEEAGMEDFAATASKQMEWHRQWIGISCWHMSGHETASMWGRYATEEQGVAIETTYATLCRELSGSVYVGRVKYVDYETAVIPEPPIFNAYLHKRLQFADDRELRAVIWRLPTKGREVDLSATAPMDGWWQPCDLSRLVARVWVSPRAPGWFSDLLPGVLSRYRIEAEVKVSSLRGQPRF